jgi:hypothetical protein
MGEPSRLSLPRAGRPCYGRARWIAPKRPIGGTEGAAYPFWSPDSKSIGFFQERNLLRVDLAGGSPLTICQVPASVGRGGAWGANGRILFASYGSGLFQVAASGGSPAPVMKPEARGDAWCLWPQLVPGGFLYVARSSTPGNSGIFAASWARPDEPVKLLDVESNALYAQVGSQGYLLWLRGPTLTAQKFDPAARKLSGEPHPVADPVAGGTTVGFGSLASASGSVLAYIGSSPVGQFIWMDRAGKPLGTVGDPGGYTSFRLSPDGRRVATIRASLGGLQFWMLDVVRGVGSLFPTGYQPVYPVWSLDSKTVVYRSGAESNLFRKDASGSGSEERLTKSPDVQSSTDWSHDGHWLLFHDTAADTGSDLWVLPVTPDGRTAPGAAPKPYLRTKDNESRGRFSPESPPRWVAYQSDETGRNEIYVQSFPVPRGKFRISTDGGQYAEWGADSLELFYVSPDNKLLAASLKPGADSIEPSAPRELFALPVMETGWSPYEVAPGGQRFLVRSTPRQAGAPLTVIVNWPSLLGKEGPAQ